MKILVRSFKRDFHFDVDPFRDIISLKDDIEQITGVPIHLQTLIHRGQVLYDFEKYQDTDITDGSILFWYTRCPRL